MDDFRTYLLLSVIMIGSIDASSAELSDGNGPLKQAVSHRQRVKHDDARQHSTSPVRGVVARSYEARERETAKRLEHTQTQPVGSCEISSNQQEMLRLVNRARARQRDCGGEIFPVAPPLKWNCRLHKAAVIHSQDMIDYDYFDHQGADGSSVGMRVSRSGYEWRAVGENIAAGYPDNEAVMANLLSSPSHCENIMDPKFREFGSAVIATDQAHYYNYWTQVFAVR
ncbi:MAG: CAP domain-containing protein [Candidatus Thiodiazotropha sp.]